MIVALDIMTKFPIDCLDEVSGRHSCIMVVSSYP